MPSPVRPPAQWRRREQLDARQHQVATLFETEPYVTTKQIAEHLGLHRRTALNLCKAWVEDGFLVQHGTAKKNRKYKLAQEAWQVGGKNLYRQAMA